MSLRADWQVMKPGMEMGNEMRSAFSLVIDNHYSIEYVANRAKLDLNNRSRENQLVNRFTHYEASASLFVHEPPHTIMSYSSPFFTHEPLYHTCV